MKTPVLERVVAGVLLVAISPLLLAVAVAVRVGSRGPAWHRAARVGQGGRTFVLFKFRSMRVERTSDDAGARITAAGDARVTRVGRVLRATKLDELPQLVNVLRGEMRFVGPRPEDPAYVDRDDPAQAELLRYVPGLTGPASVAFRHEEQVLADMIADGADPDVAYHRIAATKRNLDLEYLRSRTCGTDVRMMWSTVRSVLRPPVPAPIDGEHAAVTHEEMEALDSAYRHYRGEYASRWSGDRPGNRAILRERETVASRLVGDRHAEAGVVLDVGSGATGSFPSLFRGARRIRLDILEWRLRDVPPGQELGDAVCGDGAALPFRDASIDVVLLSTVLSSVSERVGRSMLDEIERVVRTGGLVVIYDFRVPNPRNRATHAVRRRWIRASMPGFEVAARSLTVVPQAARLLGRTAPLLYPVLGRLPFVRSHNLVVAERRG